MAPLPWQIRDGAVALKVRVTPKGGRDAVDGIAVLADGTAVLKLRVRVAPEDGAAYASVLALLARVLDLPKSRLSLDQGATSRVKTILLRAPPESLLQRLAGLAGP